MGSLSAYNNLEKVVLKFHFDADDANGHDKERCFCRIAGTSDQSSTRDAERACYWRSMVNNTLEGLVLNHISTGHTVQHIEVVDLPPVHLSVYWSDKWRKLLSSLKTLSISLWGNDLRDGCRPRNNKRYLGWIGTLKWSWFVGCPNLTELTIRAGNCTFVDGDNGSLWKASKFPLDQCHFPKLRRLTLQHFYYGADLADFFRVNIQTLESIVLHDCAVFSPYSIEEFGELKIWAELFECLAETRVPRLCRFELISNPAAKQPDVDEEDPSLELVTLLSKKPGTRIFTYSSDCSSNNLSSPSWPAMLQRYKDGKDQKAFDRLMGLVHANQLEQPWKLERLSAIYGASRMALKEDRKPRWHGLDTQTQ